MTTPDPNSDPTTPVGSEFGVTREQVRSLLPNAVLDDDTDASEFGRWVISSEQVDTWIRMVAADVSATIAGYERITDPEQVVYINGAAASVVAVGAAYWWEAARRQESGSFDYAKDLQERYQRMLDALAMRVAGWIVDLPDDPGTQHRSNIASSFPPPVFADGTRW